MEGNIIHFIASHYLVLGLLPLLGVFGMLAAHGTTGNRNLLRQASMQYVAIIVMVLAAPFLLWMLTSKP